MAKKKSMGEESINKITDEETDYTLLNIFSSG